MVNRNKTWILMIVVGIVVTATALSSFQAEGQDEKTPTNKNQSVQLEQERQQKQKDFRDQFPIAFFDAIEDTDLTKRANRRAAGERYNNRASMVDSKAPDGYDNESVLHTNYVDNIPAEPVDESELIVIAKVLDARAYLSNNRKNVYSEFSIDIKELLKSDFPAVKKGQVITVDREGGYVQYGNGFKTLNFVVGLLLPRVEREYLLFLKNPEKGPNYEIITGYELKSGSVVNLTKLSGLSNSVDVSREDFVTKIRRTVSERSQPKKEN